MRLAAGGREFESEDLFERFWARDLVALGVVDAERADEAQDVGVCDELGDCLFAQSLAICTQAWMTSWSVRLSVQLRTNSPSTLR